jgi:DNA gyrase inhibitor GyrI
MSESTISLPVQIRDLPAMRAACRSFRGQAEELSGPFEDLQKYVADAGIGPAGPLMASFKKLLDNPATGEGSSDIVEATLLVPVTRLVDDPPESVEMRRFASLRAACLLFSGPMDSSFRQHHLDLFSWLDARALPRAGTAHQHAYLSKDNVSGHWTVEIRIPILGQGPAAAAL